MFVHFSSGLDPLSIKAPSPQSRNMKTSHDLDQLIFGMASQIAEREDNIVVEDLRGDSIRNSERFLWVWETLSISCRSDDQTSCMDP